MVADTACPGLMCSFNRGNIEGTITLRKFVSDVCVCMFCFMFAKWLVLWIDLTERFINMRRVLKCVQNTTVYLSLWLEFACPEVTLCGQDIKIKLLINYLFSVRLYTAVNTLSLFIWFMSVIVIYGRSVLFSLHWVDNTSFQQIG